MITYAQHREDVVLARAFKGQRTGFYVDVGAYHPVVSSVSCHFHRLGWRGINIEPGEVFQAFQVERPDAINLRVVVSDHDGEIDFSEFPADIASASNVDGKFPDDLIGRAGSQRVTRLPCRTLASILAEHAPATIDFMSIDVEGHEGAVIRGNDWARFRPRVLVVEATQPNSRLPSHQEWEPYLLDRDYLLAQFDGLNRFYVRGEDRDLLAVLQPPVSPVEGFVHFTERGFQEATETLRETRLEVAAVRDLEKQLRRRLALYEDGTEPVVLALGVKLARSAERLKSSWVGRRLSGAVGPRLRTWLNRGLIE